MTVSSGWNSREVSLNGRLIGVTDSTPPSASRRLIRTGLRAPISPTTAMTTRSTPTWSYGTSPSARIRLFTAFVSAWLAEALITTNIGAARPFAFDLVQEPCWPRSANKKSRGLTSAHPGTTRAPGSQVPGSVMPGVGRRKRWSSCAYPNGSRAPSALSTRVPRIWVRAGPPWRPMGGHHRRSGHRARGRWDWSLANLRPSGEARAVAYPGRANCLSESSTPVALRRDPTPRDARRRPARTHRFAATPRTNSSNSLSLGRPCQAAESAAATPRGLIFSVVFCDSPERPAGSLRQPPVPPSSAAPDPVLFWRPRFPRRGRIVA